MEDIITLDTEVYLLGEARTVRDFALMYGLSPDEVLQKYKEKK